MMKFILRLIFVLLSVAALSLLIYVGSFAYYQPREGYVAIAYHHKDGYSLAEDLKPWDIKRMLPFASKIIYLSNSFHMQSFDALGELGSVKLFTNNIADINGDFFSYRLSGSASFRLTEEALVDALNKGMLESDKLSFYYSNQARLISSEIVSIMEQLLLNNSPFVQLGERDALQSAITESLHQKFPMLEWQPIILTTISLPNLSLYKEMLDASLTKVRAIADAERQVQYRAAIESATQEQRLKLLEEYGKLLTQYPILIQFFAVDSGKFLPREALEAFMPPATAGS